jgi:putative membrane-bound dehydrogenase-like protein
MLRRRILLIAIATTVIGLACASRKLLDNTHQIAAPASSGALTIKQDEEAGTISVFRSGISEPILTETAKADMRPYLHPIVAPDGKGVLTEFRPVHHPHQTGLYWGFTRLNDRDFFHNLTGDYWRRVSATILKTDTPGDVRWETVYNLLDVSGHPMMTETARWTMREQDGRFVIDLNWRGEAKTDVTIGKYDYGGLFVRMPWHEGIAGEVTNAARQKNERAEGQHAMWIDVGMQVDGRGDLAHIAIFEHPNNPGYPQAWRVDPQLGVGSARTRADDRHIGAGQTEVIRYRLLIYTGTLSDVEMTNAWGQFSGTTSTSALWTIAQREGRAATFLTPEQAVKEMTLVDGYNVNAWAGEPMVVQPMAFCWDDRGRLWVAENLDYENRVSGFSNSGRSRIVILEDTNHDGAADSRKVFMEGIIFPTALAVGFDGVFVGAPPNLLFIPDRNGDDKADVNDIEVRLTGWGIADRHETLNSFHWGPDGWLYGLQGYATSSKIRKPQGKGRIYTRDEPFPENVLQGDGVEMDGGVWRYHPTKDVFEVVAHGFSNPWGIDYDRKGQLFISACVIPHMWHVLLGGIYQRQGGQHLNPYVYSDIDTIADHRHRSAHGGARIYQSDAFPRSQLGRIFMANIHEHAVLSDILVPRGSGFVASHGDDFLMANNAQWLGFSLEIGPEGALYVLDWHDGDICGMDVLQKETGRIFRVTPKISEAVNWAGRYSDLRTMTDEQLVDLQRSASDWHARRARIILQNRAAKGTLQSTTHDRLRGIFASDENPDWRMRAMWALHVTSGWSREQLVQLLDDRDDYVRAWAVQLLCEDRAPSALAVDKFVRMGREDRSPVVRLYLASALQRLDHAADWKIASELIAHGEDASDHNIPKMLWLAIEPLVKENPAFALQRASESRIHLLTTFIARRAVDADALEPLVTEIATGSRGQRLLLEGMRQGLETRVDLAAPPNWPRVFQRLEEGDPAVARLAGDVTRLFNDTDTARHNLAQVRSRKVPLDARRRSLLTLASQRRPELVPELRAVLDDPALRIDGIRAIAAYDNEALGQLLIDRYTRLNAAEKTEAVETLASRRSYARMLTDALSEGAVPRRDIPAFVARQLVRVLGPAFTDVWGPVDSANEERAFARYRSLLNDGALAAADTRRGRSVFLRTCGPCHKMYGEGGEVGPDLTGSNRANRDYLLFNVLNPSGEVQDAYRMVVVTTRDGRTLSGNIAAETARQVTLRVIGRDPVVINKAEIQSREVTAVSMMPPGLFDTLEDREILDLVAFLRTVQPVK